MNMSINCLLMRKVHKVKIDVKAKGCVILLLTGLDVESSREDENCGDAAAGHFKAVNRLTLKIF